MADTPVAEPGAESSGEREGERPSAAEPVGHVAANGRSRRPAMSELWQAAAIQATVLALAFALLVLLQRLAVPLALLFLAIVIGEALTPLVNRLARWMPRVVALGCVYLALGAVAFGLGWLIVPHLSGELSAIGGAIPKLIGLAEQLVNSVVPGLGTHLAAGLQTTAGPLIQNSASLALNTASVVIESVVVLFLSIYWILTAGSLHRFALSLVPDELRPQAAALFDELGTMLGGYVRSVVLDALLIGTVAYVGLRVLGVPFALLLALTTGLGDLVPLVGPTVAWFIGTGIALTVSPALAVETLIFYIVLGQIDANVTLPAIARGTARIPPLLLIFALVSGGMLAGVLGAVIAIPLFGALRIVTVRVLAPLVRRWWQASATAT